MRNPEKIQERLGTGGWKGGWGRRAIEAAMRCLSMVPFLDHSVLYTLTLTRFLRQSGSSELQRSWTERPILTWHLAFM